MPLELVPPPPPPETSGESLGDYVGEIVILEPVEATKIDTTQGESEVVFCNAFVWKDATLTDLGRLPVFWTKVRAQLSTFVGSGKVVVGRIERNGRAYELSPIGDTPTIDAIGKALEAATAEEPF